MIGYKCWDNRGSTLLATFVMQMSINRGNDFDFVGNLLNVSDLIYEIFVIVAVR